MTTKIIIIPEETLDRHYERTLQRLERFRRFPTNIKSGNLPKELFSVIIPISPNDEKQGTSENGKKVH